MPYAMLVDLGTTCGRAFSTFTMGISGADRRTLVIRPVHGLLCPLGHLTPVLLLERLTYLEIVSYYY